MAGIDTLVSFADKMGIINKVKSKLIKQPDPAAEKLITALEEISKIYAALDSEISRYLSTYFDDKQTSKERSAERKNLIELEGGEISARMGKSRGHCSKILNIYHKYLTTWFDKILSTNEKDLMAELFLDLDEFDGHMVNAIEQVAQWLADEAHETLNFVDEKPPQLEKANQRIGQSRRTIFEKRRAIANSMSTLLDLQAEFIGMSGAV